MTNISNTETFFFRKWRKIFQILSLMAQIIGIPHSIATLKIRVVIFWDNIQHYKLDVYIVHLYTRGNRLCTLKSVESTLSANVRVVTLHHPTINVHRKFRSALDPLEWVSLLIITKKIKLAFSCVYWQVWRLKFHP